ncbi:carbohydrate kinase [Roseospira marina]|uniref:Carbohydrate kinase n=1 Tax=Roseospira marina TaxID=140057 RepID=A0A5M6IDE1_9PROT|nr:carbohydrate kinase [Roseospira marina]KAA5606291.1 carbohydrate kinase [Roseospira marina]MBB4314449.1 fructokinase [Roseospira marina]MBB5087609.1 fructokinase [Roseospira marina]
MFLICGEALFDVFVTEERADGVALDARPGGSPFNVAFGLARLGQRAELLTGLSTDTFGGYLRGFMAREGVGAAYAMTTPKPTTLVVVALDANGVPTYSFSGTDTADRALTPDTLPPLAPDIRAVHMGSIATVLEPVASALKALARRESGARLISYDPNVRPTVEPSLAVWRQSLADLVGLAHVVKISREDLDLLYPGLSPADAAARWLAAGTGLVVVTDGGNGVAGWTRAGSVTCPPHPVTVVDTVGAGDSFQAGLLAALAEMDRLWPAGVAGLDAPALEAALTFAGRAAALTCSRRGADLPRRDALPETVVSA